MKRVAVLLVCLLPLVAPGADKAVSPPDFSITVNLSERAQKKFREAKETIVVLAHFADEIGPDEVKLGEAKFELQGPGTVTVRNVVFPKNKVSALRNADYEVLVSVFSERHSSKQNMLVCEPLLQGPISKFQKKTLSVMCDLGKWVK